MMRVCVIGSGVAGLACALAAASRGAVVQMFDRAAGLGAETGYVEIIPSMMRDLVALGVGDACVRHGFAFHGIQVIDRKGRTVGEIPTPRLAGDRFPAALGMTYAGLLRVLESAAVARGVRMSWDTAVERVDARDERPSMLHLRSGDEVEADLVLLAGGGDSKLRSVLFPEAGAIADVGQAWLYAMVQRPVDLDRPRIALGGIGTRAVLVPVRTDVAGIALCEPLAQAPRDGALPAHFRKLLLNFAPGVQVLARQIPDDARVTRRLARSGVMAGPWSHSRVLAVGDCAHALPPQFGQASAQAIEDAVVLGDLLDTCTDRDELLERFNERRLARVRKVHELVTMAARWGAEPESRTNLGALMRELMNTVADPA